MPFWFRPLISLTSIPFAFLPQALFTISPLLFLVWIPNLRSGYIDCRMMRYRDHGIRCSRPWYGRNSLWPHFPCIPLWNGLLFFCFKISSPINVFLPKSTLLFSFLQPVFPRTNQSRGVFGISIIPTIAHMDHMCINSHPKCLSFNNGEPTQIC